MRGPDRDWMCCVLLLTESALSTGCQGQGREGIVTSVRNSKQRNRLDGICLIWCHVMCAYLSGIKQDNIPKIYWI